MLLARGMMSVSQCFPFGVTSPHIADLQLVDIHTLPLPTLEQPRRHHELHVTSSTNSLSVSCDTVEYNDGKPGYIHRDDLDL